MKKLRFERFALKNVPSAAHILSKNKLKAKLIENTIAEISQGQK